MRDVNLVARRRTTESVTLGYEDDDDDDEARSFDYRSSRQESPRVEVLTGRG